MLLPLTRHAAAQDADREEAEASRATTHDDDEGGRAYPTYGIIGIMNIESHIFIIIITERNVVAKMPSGDAVYLITGVEFIPFDKNITEYTNMPLELVKFVDGIKNVLQNQGFYYSYHADMTSSQQR